MIVWQTTAKERIRLLSVRLLEFILRRAEMETALGEPFVVTVGHHSLMTKERHELLMGELSDFHLANVQFLAGREDTNLSDLKVAAAERIMWLSYQLIAEGIRAKLLKDKLDDRNRKASNDT